MFVGETQQLWEALGSERQSALLWLATVIGALPKRFRNRFFAHLHPELRQFLSQRPSVQVRDVERIALPVQGALWLANVDGRSTLQLALVFAGFDGEGVAVPLTVRWPMGRNRAIVRVEGDEGLVSRLVEVVKGLSGTERTLLWLLLDDALADHEEHLSSINPEPAHEREETLEEKENSGN